MGWNLAINGAHPRWTLAPLRGALVGLLRPVKRGIRRARYALHRFCRLPAGELVYTFTPWTPTHPAGVLVLVRAEGERAVQEAAARAFCADQTLSELTVIGLAADGSERFRVAASGGVAARDAAWFMAPGQLPALSPQHLETCLLVAAAESVDAVGMARDLVAQAAAAPSEAQTSDDLLTPKLRQLTLFSRSAYTYDPAADRVLPPHQPHLVKWVDRPGVAAIPQTPAWLNARRRGPYLASQPLGPRLTVALRDASRLARKPHFPAPARPAVLVLTSFLAQGGAEHTLFETLHALVDRFTFSIVTLAPHLPERGDRRADFQQICPRLFALGDLVHPAAMPGILLSLLAATGAEVVYNANGTTLFYEFAPQLKAARPGLRIIDHLYDHRVGYIERYLAQEDLASLDRWVDGCVDCCVAENHRIAAELLARGWPQQRVPVIWPCGRRAEAFPQGDAALAVRAQLRAELGYGPDDLVLLTAARMHPQKRPLDLVALAARLRDLPQVHFLVVGGGELAADVDAAIESSRARIRRLPFRDDIPQLILAADVGCLVSEYEGLPVFLLECLQAGRPFLGTDVGELGTVLRRTGAGLVVEHPGDLAALEAAVRDLAGAQLRAALAVRAVTAGREFSVATCAERYAAVFLGQPPAGER